MDFKSSALLVIDVQQALCFGEYAGFEAERVIDRINGLSARLRALGSLVVFIQHASEDGPLALDSPGWALAEGLHTQTSDHFVGKTACDSFHKTSLHEQLQARGIQHLIICGLQSEFCVDSTTRRALALGYPVTLIADGHTTLDSQTLSARQIIAHHNETLANIDSFGPRVTAVVAAKVFDRVD